MIERITNWFAGASAPFLAKAALIAGAAVLSLVLSLSSALWLQSWRLGNAQERLGTAKMERDQAQEANRQWSEAAATLQTSLDECETQFATVQESAAIDRERRKAEIDALETRLQETQSDLSRTLQDEATPELAACLPLPVPANSLERLRNAADNAAGAGRDRETGLDSGPG